MKAFAVIAALLLLVCCRTSREVTQDSVRVVVHDTIVQIKSDTSVVERSVLRVDSVFVRDSVFVAVDSAGNRTREVWHWRYNWQSSDAQVSALRIENAVLRHQRDSIASASHVSEVVKTEKQPLYERVKNGILSMIIGAIFSLMYIFLFYRRRSSRE